MFEPALVGDRDRHAENRKTVQEIRCAIEWIDDPDSVRLAALSAFLSKNGVIRMVFQYGFTNSEPLLFYRPSIAEIGLLFTNTGGITPCTQC